MLNYMPVKSQERKDGTMESAPQVEAARAAVADAVAAYDLVAELAPPYYAALSVAGDAYRDVLTKINFVSNNIDPALADEIYAPLVEAMTRAEAAERR